MKDKLSDAKDWLVETGGNVLSGLKDGLSENRDSIGDWFQDLPNKISNAIPDLFNTGKNAIQNFASGFGSVHIPLPHVSVSWNKHNVGPVSFSTPSFGLSWYAKGGFPESGEMFMARESVLSWSAEWEAKMPLPTIIRLSKVSVPVYMMLW